MVPVWGCPTAVWAGLGSHTLAKVTEQNKLWVQVAPTVSTTDTGSGAEKFQSQSLSHYLTCFPQIAGMGYPRPTSAEGDSHFQDLVYCFLNICPVAYPEDIFLPFPFISIHTIFLTIRLPTILLISPHLSFFLPWTPQDLPLPPNSRSLFLLFSPSPNFSLFSSGYYWELLAHSLVNLLFVPNLHSSFICKNQFEKILRCVCMVCLYITWACGCL